jgi:hypothetical protein
LDIRLPSSRIDYEPVRLAAPARAAAYSANLLIILILVGGEVTGRELFPGASETVTEWRCHALLWRSQLSQDGWAWLAGHLNFRRTGTAGNRDVLVATAQNGPLRQTIDPYWSWDEPPARETGKQWSWLKGSYEEIRQETTSCVTQLWTP